MSVRRAVTVYDKPRPARLIMAEALGITPDEAAEAMRALVRGGYGIAPRNPTNGMLAGYLEALTPPRGHEQVITAIGKARARWIAMLDHGTEMALSKKFIPPIPPCDENGVAECDETSAQPFCPCEQHGVTACDASADTLPKGRDAKQGSVGTKGSAVPKADAPNTQSLKRGRGK